MSAYLLDTCTFAWLCSEPERLSDAARSSIDAAGTRLVLSDVTALELTLKWSAGKIELCPIRHGTGSSHRLRPGLSIAGRSNAKTSTGPASYPTTIEIPSIACSWLRQ